MKNCRRLIPLSAILIFFLCCCCCWCIYFCIQIGIPNSSSETETSSFMSVDGGDENGFKNTKTKTRKYNIVSMSMSMSMRRRLLGGLGSSPPRCKSKCGQCSPCKPVHVPVPPGTPVLAEYYPEAWRCKCGNKLYMP
ncbi:hypothetical protein ACJIZ3_012420 [Penstemon smallii]|uniref:Epidermal patterning factor-like protein n=1 Tax=Penstemon smallii TaxID=265156 RepID=A0ABD3UPV5_9LAMI